MIHARSDYNRIQDPAIDNPNLLTDNHSAIGVDEPVMLFRAKDRHFLNLLAHYANALERSHNLELANTIKVHMKLVDEWQTKNNNLVKEPDL